METFKSFLEKIDVQQLTTQYVIPWVSNILFAILIFVIGRLISKWIVALVRRGLGRSKLDAMLINFVLSILSWILFLVVLVATLDQLQVDTTSFIALLGAAGLAVGLALKDSLQNFASGVMLILFRPFKAGDFVSAGGAEGVVEEIRIFSTTMRTPDNREVVVPNGDIFTSVIINNNARETRRIDFVIGIGYDDDLKRAKEVFEKVLAEHPAILQDPAPQVAVCELADSSVNFVVRPWCKTEDYFDVMFDVTERIKLACDANGISIPFPQRDVHLHQVA